MKRKRIRKTLLKQTAGRCFYCNQSISLKGKKNGKKTPKMTIDHFIPRYHDGKNGKQNLRAACSDCNSKKGHMMPEEFIKEGAK